MLRIYRSPVHIIGVIMQTRARAHVIAVAVGSYSRFARRTRAGCCCTYRPGISLDVIIFEVKDRDWLLEDSCSLCQHSQGKPAATTDSPIVRT